MIKVIISIILALFPVIHVASAEEDFKEFELTFKKSGDTEFYFTEVGSSIPKMDAVRFRLSDSTASTTAEVGVYYHIFSIDDNMDKFRVGVYVIASSEGVESSSSENGDYVIFLPTTNQYMLANVTNPAYAGLNYEIANDIEAKGASNSVENNAPLDVGNRTLKIFEGEVDPEIGVEGNSTLSLSIDPPAAETGYAFPVATYKGYLTLYVKTLS